VTDAEAEAHIAELEGAVEAERAAIRDALARGVLIFPDRHGLPGHRITITLSARPDCPPGHMQLTRWAGGVPIGHTYATREETAHEVWAIGYEAPA